MSTILVVDDDAYMRELLHLHLSNLLATVAGYVEGGRFAL